MINKDLIRIIRSQFVLDWNGIHGASHWARVRKNGLRLAEVTGANVAVVELFSFLHDARRENDNYDPYHGFRAADFARSLAGKVFELETNELELLATACEGHSEGLLEGDITVLTCWDADRLDLGRVGIKPRPAKLCTEAARESTMLSWSYERSIR